MRISDWSSDVCSSDLYNAMTEVMNTIESVRSQKNPATGRARSTAEVLRESARLLADPRSPEGQKFRQSTRGLQFQATFQRLPIYARDRDGNVTHPFGLIDPSAFAQAKIGRASCRERVCQYV